MRQVGRGKPLTGSYSFETSCTFDEPSQKAIQVNVIQPKRKGSTEQSFDDRLFLSQDNGQFASESVKRQRQAPVTAYFPQKREAPREHAMEGSFGIQVKTQNPHQIKTIDQKVQQNPSKLSEAIEASAKQSSLKNKQKNVAPKDHIVQIAEQLQSNSRRKGSKGDSVQIDFSQDESMRNLNESLLIDIEERQISDQLLPAPPTAKFLVPQIPINAALENRQSRAASIHSQRDRSNSKMKLRDYLYMVETTSKQSSLQKRQQGSLTKQVPQVKTVHKVDKGKQEGGVMTERSILITKREHGMMKYSVSNGKMLDILKKEIHEDISLVEASLKKLDQEIADFRVAGGTQPTNEQLLILYGIRRQVKQEISKRLEMAMQAINEHKKALASSSNPQSQKQLFLGRNQH